MASSTTTPMSTKRKLECIDGGNDFACHPIKRRSHNRTPNEIYSRMPIMGRLYSQLCELGVKGQIPILCKALTATDLNPCHGRLLLPNKMVEESPLLKLLTNEEKELVKSTGLVVRMFDWYGKEYNMLLRFLQCNHAYRLIQGWSKFLRISGGVLRKDDAIEIQGFRIPRGDGRMEFGMALLHHGKVEVGEAVVEREVCNKREDKAVESKEVRDKREDNQQEERNEAMSTEDEDELLVIDALLMLSKVKP